MQNLVLAPALSQVVLAVVPNHLVLVPNHRLADLNQEATAHLNQCLKAQAQEVLVLAAPAALVHPNLPLEDLNQVHLGIVLVQRTHPHPAEILLHHQIITQALPKEVLSQYLFHGVPLEATVLHSEATLADQEILLEAYFQAY
jgi:hypothetical protein